MTKQSQMMKRTLAMVLGFIMLIGMSVTGFAYNVSSDLAGTKYEDAGAVLAVEWSENIETALPTNAVRVSIRALSETEREITIEGVTL